MTKRDRQMSEYAAESYGKTPAERGISHMSGALTDHITTTTVNFKDWVLGRGKFSEENLKKARDEFFTKLGKHRSDLMLASVEKAFSDLDAVPEARANAESVAPQPTAGDRSGNPTSHSGTGNTQEPVAWAVENASVATGLAWLIKREAVDFSFQHGGRIVPLYSSPTLTDEEREAIETAVRWLEPYPQVASTLRKLLDREGDELSALPPADRQDITQESQNGDTLPACGVWRDRSDPPPLDKPVLFYTNHLDGFMWIGRRGLLPNDVSHWTYLPEPPNVK